MKKSTLIHLPFQIFKKDIPDIFNYVELNLYSTLKHQFQMLFIKIT